VTLDSEAYRRVVRTTALYTLILVPFFRCFLFHTRLNSLPNALFAFASQLQSVVNFPVDLGILRDGASQVGELVDRFQF